MTPIRRKKWPNVLEYQPVSTSTVPPERSSKRLLLENFDTRDVRWAPDGKGFVLLDRDQFCCAFEVEDEEGA